MNFAVVILAAGASSRMGRPKLLLPWGDGTVLAHLVATWRQLGAAHIAVVTAPLRGLQEPERRPPAWLDPTGRTGQRAVPEAGAPMAAELDRLGITREARIENPQPQFGMFSSVRCAAGWPGWRPGLTHWVLTLGDQPHVGTPTLRALLDFAAANPAKICQPARQGRPRHPVLLPGAVVTELAGTAAENLKQFLVAHAGQRVCFESDDTGLDFDLDEPADYERALRHSSPLKM